MNRGEVLDEAKRLTYGDRNVSYDEPRINHKRIGVLLGMAVLFYVLRVHGVLSFPLSDSHSNPACDCNMSYRANASL